MKKSLYISILMAIAALFSSCEQEYTSSTDWGDWDIFKGYMQFSTDVLSRAELATNMRNRNFGVLGYQYSSTTNWDAAKALAKPSVFYKQKVSCNNNGICTYDINISEDGNQLKQWEDGSYYSFFAYHPYDGQGITISGQDIVNTPTLEYTYNWFSKAQGDSRIDVYQDDNHVFDLMTAEDIDCDGSGNVALDFKHRMFAIEVLANNYNENSEGTTDARRTISDLVLSITGLTHSTMKIPMSTQSGEADPEYTGSMPTTVRFGISNKPVEIPAFNETKDWGNGVTSGGGIATSISEYGSDNRAGYVMLIPQSTELEFAITWSGASFQPNQNIINSTMEFKAGNLYQIIINFIGSGITIALIEAGAWEHQSVKHTFE